MLRDPLHQKESIKTCVRVKPVSPNEEKVFYLQDSRTLISKSNAKFVYDHVFDDKASTDYIYDIAAKQIVQQAFHGFNGCIMAYGQTCSGKTHTMKGTLECPGIVPLALSDIFNTIAFEDISAKIHISYMEIYNQNVFDLLADTNNIQVKVLANENNLYLGNLKQFRAQSFQSALAYFNKGQEKRKFASNNLNVNSSRSHTIFRISFSVCTDNLEELKAQIDLVDLAGSQSLDKTKNQKTSRTQGENINKSLLALSKVITILSQKSDAFIVYRESKLTRILQKSLCENSKSSIICMINPNQSNYQESLNTLKFGQKALKIKIQAKQNINKSAESRKQQTSIKNQLLSNQKYQLEEARQKIKQNEFFIRQLRQKSQELENYIYKKDMSYSLIQRELEETKNQFQNQKFMFEKQANQWWKQKLMFQNRAMNDEKQIENLEKRNDELRKNLRTVEKNQKSLVQSLQHYENQCKHLRTQIIDIKSKVDEENSKNTRRLSNKGPITIERPKTKEKQNNFYVPPFRQNPQRERIEPSQLAWIFRLKTEVMELKNKILEYTKANIEIAEENNQLRIKIEENEEKKSKDRTSGKINPEALEYNEIKKLKKKITSLKAELNISQKNVTKYRDILKNQTAKNLLEMQEYEEWFYKKYGGCFLLDQQTQTDFFGQKNVNFQNQHDSIFGQGAVHMNQKMEIDQQPFISEKIKSSSKSQASNRNHFSTSSNPFIKNDNPQSNKKSSTRQKQAKSQNIDTNMWHQRYHHEQANVLNLKEDRDSNILLLDSDSDPIERYQDPQQSFRKMKENQPQIQGIHLMNKEKSFWQSLNTEKKEEMNIFSILKNRNLQTKKNEEI